ncbi:MAG: sigma-70 family RNA polymerase sigma factor [Chitinophagaceae bacterium]|nr:sigma-70 family RNA polymerase sigma factor [Chitinophagaceae bacterium]
MHQDISLTGDSDSEIIGNLKLTGTIKRLAEEQLFKKYLYFTREAVNKYSLSDDNAFDAYSDTVLSAIGTISSGTFENRSSLKTYIYRIFNNKCVDLIRKNTTNKSSVNKTMPAEDMLSQLSDTAKSIVQEMIEKTDYDNIRRKLSELGSTCKEVLTQFADGCSDREIAVVMKYKSADVVKTTRLRCLEKLRQLYKLK